MRLLLTEPEKRKATEMKTLLKHEGYFCDIVRSASETLEYLKTGKYDILITDIILPDSYSSSYITLLRNSGICLPILVLTSDADIDVKVSCLDAGANDYLTFPYHPKELLARIRILGRSQMHPLRTTLSAGNITLNCATHQLSSASVDFPLTNKEFLIMEILMSNPSHLISTDQLLEKVWGYDSSTGLNTVWAHISGLRKKLRQMNANVQIKASRNFGHRLIVT